jgi:uncharacterized protein YbjT (DUF2867 family)
MKYVITGGAGNISKPLAEQLKAAGHDVTVIGRSAANLETLTQQGIKAAIGSVEDTAFLTETFKGADAVYLMIPPNYATSGWREYQNAVGRNYVLALQQSGVTHAVVLSSMGAHAGEGVGPVNGLADFEKMLAPLSNLHVKLLRPSYFMYNLFGMLPLIQHMNIMGGNYGGTEEKLALVHTKDIAAAAFEELNSRSYTGHTVRYIVGDERHPTEIASVLSNAIGKPGIPWVVFTDEQAKAGMLQAGMNEAIAAGYTELGHALATGLAQEDYWKNRPPLTATKLEDFAKEFAAAYQHA